LIALHVVENRRSGQQALTRWRLIEPTFYHHQRIGLPHNQQTEFARLRAIFVATGSVLCRADMKKQGPIPSRLIRRHDEVYLLNANPSDRQPLIDNLHSVTRNAEFPR